MLVVEAHGVIQNRLVCVPFTKSAATKQVKEEEEGGIERRGVGNEGERERVNDGG